MDSDIKYYWEDFISGERKPLGSIVVDKDELIEFARRFDPQPFHIDEVAAKKSIYGGLIASGWYTCSLVMRVMCDAFLLESASLGSSGLDDIKWPNPVRPGDTLTVYRTIVDSRASNSRPDR